MSRYLLKYILLLLLTPVCKIYAQPDDTTQVRKKKPENPQEIRHIIKTNPLPLLWGPIPFTSELRYVQEIPVAPYQSTQIGFSLLGKSIILNALERGAYQNPNQPQITVRGYRMQFSHRIFLSMLDYAPEGSYISPNISYASAKFSTRYLNMFDNYIQATHYNFTILGGYQTISYNVVVDMFAGIGYKRNKIEVHQYNQTIPLDLDEMPFYRSPLKFVLGFNVGWAF